MVDKSVKRSSIQHSVVEDFTNSLFRFVRVTQRVENVYEEFNSGKGLTVKDVLEKQLDEFRKELLLKPDVFKENVNRHVFVRQLSNGK